MSTHTNNVVLSAISLVAIVNGFQHRFAKMATLDDADIDFIFKDHMNISQQSYHAPTLSSCAAKASRSLQFQVKSERASAFKYVDRTCTLGTSPMYMDWTVGRKPVSQDEDGVHVVENIKSYSKELHEDLMLYLLFNEEEQWKWSHKYFPIFRLNNTTPLPSSYTLLSPVTSLQGKRALHFQSQEIKYAMDPPLKLEKFSIMCWYYLDSGSNSNKHIMFAIENVDEYFWFYMNLSNKVMTFKIRRSEGRILLKSQTMMMPYGKWAYLGFVYDGSVINGKTDSRVSFYHDGSHVGSASHSWSNGDTGELLDYTQAYVGHKRPDRNGSLTGHMASVELFKEALTQDQVQEVMVRSTNGRIFKP